jgi:transmembrane sensor
MPFPNLWSAVRSDRSPSMIWPVGIPISLVPTDSGPGAPPHPPDNPRRADDERPQRRPIARTLAVLAAVAITTGSASLFVRDTPGIEYYATRVGERRPLPLRDGSVITLNTDTKLKIRRDGPTLYVRILKGEVHFNMLPNPQRRLIVSVGDRLDVIDIATIFDIRLTDSGGARITVQEGQVELSAAQLADVQLRQNQQAAVDFGPGQLAIRTRAISPAEIERQLSWLQGHLVYQCETLSNVAREFNRYNRTHIEITDSLTGAIQVGGIFSTTDPDTFAKGVMRMTPNLLLDSIPGPDGTHVLKLHQGPHSKQQSSFTSNCTPNPSFDQP